MATVSKDVAAALAAKYPQHAGAVAAAVEQGATVTEFVEARPVKVVSTVTKYRLPDGTIVNLEKKVDK